jgi:hypothetical protein
MWQGEQELPNINKKGIVDDFGNLTERKNKW